MAIKAKKRKTTSFHVFTSRSANKEPTWPDTDPGCHLGAAGRTLNEKILFP